MPVSAAPVIMEETPGPSFLDLLSIAETRKGSDLKMRGQGSSAGKRLYSTIVGKRCTSVLQKQTGTYCAYHERLQLRRKVRVLGTWFLYCRGRNSRGAFTFKEGGAGLKGPLSGVTRLRHSTPGGPHIPLDQGRVCEGEKLPLEGPTASLPACWSPLALSS